MTFPHPNYNILATLGPASQEAGLWQAMLRAGATGFRLNTSHLSLDSLSEWLARLAPFLSGQDGPVPLVLDLQGSKWRLGQFPAAHLQAGETVELFLGPESSQAAHLPVPHPDFFAAAAVSGRLLALNDARLVFQVEQAGPDHMVATVLQGGQLSPHKGITYTAGEYRQETLSEKDQAILQMQTGLPEVRYAISYVRDAAEMARYRQRAGGRYLIAKLERQPAVSEAAAIATHADELWLCRGDLGAELGLVGMAAAAHAFAAQVHSLPVPVLLAGQVLEHLTGHPTPTRAEMCSLYDALAQGYRGVVLSDETALGRDPVESCRTAAVFK